MKSTAHIVLMALLVSSSTFGQATIDRIREASSATQKADAARVLAELSAHAYEPPKSPKGLPPGCKLIDERSNMSGFRGKAYSLNEGEDKEEKKEIAIAFAGTDASKLEWLMFFAIGTLPADFETDKQLILGKKPAQFREADSFVKSIQARFPRRRIVLTGHSLGGAQAVYVAQRHRLDCVAFNAPALNASLFGDVPYSNRLSSKNWRIVVLQSSGNARWLGSTQDLVSAWSSKTYANLPFFDNAIVETVKVPTGCKLDRLCHGIGHFLERDASWKKKAKAPR